MNRYALAFFTALVSLPLPLHAACPSVAALPDVNCDGAATIVVLGDSLVAGIGDTANENQGGYVLRTQGKFPDARIIGHGVPGLRTTTLIKRLRDAFAGKKYPAMTADLLDADLVVLDLGRNDRWFFGPPASTLRNLQRIRTLIREQVAVARSQSPVIVQPVLMLPNRGSQGPWVKELNTLILNAHTAAYPCDLRFDLVSKRLLAPDNIHPTSKGYTALAQTFMKYLRSIYPRYAQAHNRERQKHRG
jgi:lysophospholipase L1-like esterase